MPNATIYHNPRCSKSRQTLAILQEHEVSVEIIEYLQTPLDIDLLRNIGSMLNMSPREFMRVKEDIYRDNQLADVTVTDQQLLEAIVAHPILLERPIVVVDNKAVIGRPPENVLALLDTD